MASLPRPEGAVQGQGARPQPRFGNGSAPGQRLQPGLPATGWIQSRIAARTKVTACSPRPLPPKKKPPEGRGGETRSGASSLAKQRLQLASAAAKRPLPRPPPLAPHRRLIARYLLMFFFHPSKRWSSACSGAAPALLCLQATLRRRSTGGEGGSPRDAGSAAPTAALGGLPSPPTSPSEPSRGDPGSSLSAGPGCSFPPKKNPSFFPCRQPV